MRTLIVALFLCAAAPHFAQAHGDEDHGGGAPAPAPMSGDGFETASAASETFELVLKYPALPQGQEVTLRIFLTDSDSNAPIEKATIEMKADGPAPIKAAVSETAIHGIYEARMSFPEKGDYRIAFNIQAGDTADVLIIDKVSAGTGGLKRSLTGIVLGLLKWALILVFSLGLAVLLWRNRGILKARKAVVAVAVLAGITGTASGHEGESHGPEVPASAAPASAGGAIRLSKESQFLLGVRTAVVSSQKLRKRVLALGRVVPKSQGKADVVSLQAGKLIADEHYGFPRIGDRVKKGQIVAEIQVIDSFHVLAPISGVVTEVNFTAGEWVEQGKKLLTIVDSAVVWVEAGIFENDLPAIAGANQAFIKSKTYPDREYRGGLVTLGKVLDPETRSVKAVFEVASPDEKLLPGMFVDVSIETRASEEALAVPESAVLDKDGQRVAFVKTGPESFTVRAVEIGNRYGGLLSIKSGLLEGDRVVVTGNYQLLTTQPTSAGSK